MKTIHTSCLLLALCLLPGEEAGACSPINEEQYRNRMLLREAMLRHGFLPYECEW